MNFFKQNAQLPEGANTDLLIECYYREMNEEEKNGLSPEDKVKKNPRICKACEGTIVFKFIIL